MKRLCSTLNYATEKIGRTFPQHQEMSRGYDYEASDSVHRLSPQNFPDFVPNFNTVILAGSAKATDLISMAPMPQCGYLVSGRFRFSDALRKAIEQEKISGVRFGTAKLFR